jgi:hypothetical protein
MMENTFVPHLNSRVRRLFGPELALIREEIRRGKKVLIASDEDVSFQPSISLNPGVSIE